MYGDNAESDFKLKLLFVYRIQNNDLEIEQQPTYEEKWDVMEKTESVLKKITLDEMIHNFKLIKQQIMDRNPDIQNVLVCRSREKWIICYHRIYGERENNNKKGIPYN